MTKVQKLYATVCFECNTASCMEDFRAITNQVLDAYILLGQNILQNCTNRVETN